MNHLPNWEVNIIKQNLKQELIRLSVAIDAFANLNRDYLLGRKALTLGHLVLDLRNCETELDIFLDNLEAQDFEQLTEMEEA